MSFLWLLCHLYVYLPTCQFHSIVDWCWFSILISYLKWSVIFIASILLLQEYSLYFCFCLKAKHQYYMYVCDCILYFFFVLTFKRIIYIKLTTPPLLAVYFFLAAKVYQLLIILLFNLVVEIQLWINHK